MKKSYLFLATAIIALASCSENTYLGDQEGAAQGNGAISFGSNLPTLTRAGGTSTDAQRLGYSFAVYATKTTKNSSDQDVVSNVFAHNPYSSDANATNTPYWVWYNTSTANTTASNTSNWEYVGAAGEKDLPESKKFTLSSNQEIKYWDYSATQYDFVAYKNTEGTPTITNYTTSGFTVTATAAQLAGLYVADKITITAKNNTPGTLPSGDNPTKIGDIVQFTFRSAGAKVRLGIYETINGYEVRNVKFYYDSNPTSTTNAYLTGTFNGNGTSSEPAKVYNVTYNSTSGIAEFNTPTSVTPSNYFDFGTFDTDADPATSILGTTSIAPTWATGSATYKAVMPNTDHVACMILKVDYELHNTTTGETIKVTGAKAAVPAAFMKWEPNHAYTYLFKISDNTNGHTGPDTTPEGLYPITFDAVTIASDGTEGTITTVTTPSITTYQEGSVTDAGIKYTYNSTSTKPIYFTAQNNETGSVIPLSNSTAAVGKVLVYKVADLTATTAPTEADLQITPPTSGGITPTLVSSETTVGNQKIPTGAACFTPSSTGYYAIQYVTAVSSEEPPVATAYAYKIVKVEADS